MLGFCWSLLFYKVGRVYEFVVCKICGLLLRERALEEIIFALCACFGCCVIFCGVMLCAKFVLLNSCCCMTFLSGY